MVRRTESTFCFTDRPVANYRDNLAGGGAMLARLNAGLLERGVLKGGRKYYPSAVHTEEYIDRTIEAYRQVSADAAGVIPCARGWRIR